MLRYNILEKVFGPSGGSSQQPQRRKLSPYGSRAQAAIDFNNLMALQGKDTRLGLPSMLDSGSTSTGSSSSSSGGGWHSGGMMTPQGLANHQAQQALEEAAAAAGVSVEQYEAALAAAEAQASSSPPDGSASSGGGGQSSSGSNSSGGSTSSGGGGGGSSRPPNHFTPSSFSRPSRMAGAGMADIVQALGLDKMGGTSRSPSLNRPTSPTVPTTFNGQQVGMVRPKQMMRQVPDDSAWLNFLMGRVR